MMRKNKLNLFTVSVLYLLSTSVIAQVKSNVCLIEVENIFKKMYEQIPTLSKTTFVNYIVTTKARQELNAGKNSISVADIKYYSNNNNVWFISDDLCMYKDLKNTFTVIPNRKVVYWAETTIANKKQDRLMQMQNAHDSIFKNCKNVECINVNDGSEITKIVKVTLEKKWVDLFQIKTINYYINSQKKEIIKQVIEYTNSKKFEYVEYVFKEINYDYKKVNVDIPVKNLFIKAKNTLIAPYNTFQLIDVRKNK